MERGRKMGRGMGMGTGTDTGRGLGGLRPTPSDFLLDFLLHIFWRFSAKVKNPGGKLPPSPPIVSVSFVRGGKLRNFSPPHHRFLYPPLGGEKEEDWEGEEADGEEDGEGRKRRGKRMEEGWGGGRGWGRGEWGAERGWYGGRGGWGGGWGRDLDEGENGEEELQCYFICCVI